jgi:galactose mutarotase-like enzyme
MRLLHVKNGKGLEFTVSADRCADISRLSFGGDNFGYFAPCGYVAPAYYVAAGTGFMQGFTAGFLTTCGLTTVGPAANEEGEELPMHGNISYIPADNLYWTEDETQIVIHAEMKDEMLFGRKLRLLREIHCSRTENVVRIADTVVNDGSAPSPLMILYHMNMGYPLLSEDAQLTIPSAEVTPRNAHAGEDLDTWNKILPPTPGFEEQCYYHAFRGAKGSAGIGKATLFNPAIGKGIEISFDLNRLPYFTQWKMQGERDYVLGLEPGNCHVDGRRKMREEGKLEYIAPGESKRFSVTLKIIEEELK